MLVNRLVMLANVVFKSKLSIKVPKFRSKSTDAPSMMFALETAKMGEIETLDTLMINMTSAENGTTTIGWSFSNGAFEIPLTVVKKTP